MELTRELERAVRKARQIQRRIQTQLERLLHHLPREEREILMADFTAANAALASIQAKASEVVTAFQALQNTDDQASVDALTSGMNGVQSQLAALVAAPEAPPAEPT